ncbi:hypothetical protein [Teredinibacter sp. KSP-S5-2]|uniref:hypothetical protein n=1 Tax=Teredinibacter sp. KSP-S5-2 TaxID=3034506 RepID=UPI00293506F8|nr:hypothetical protein [Teredinibacter sp. KSP-S5-2]WNO10576.1 hypothetical protein P5V12_05255 [Teredinibacter sp. KSP-S5-2]
MKELSIKWSENPKYIKAKNKEYESNVGHLTRLSFVILFVLFVFAIWLFGGRAADYKIVLPVSLIIGFLLAYPGYSLLRSVPQNISLTKRVVVIDRERFEYKNINQVVLGAIELYGTSFPIMQIILNSSEERIIGLPERDIVEDIEEIFVSHDVSVKKMK